ncbi:MAG: hypothetical protein ACRENH_05185, partial [Gemmatimonadaceae bacterium]
TPGQSSRLPPIEACRGGMGLTCFHMLVRHGWGLPLWRRERRTRSRREQRMLPRCTTGLVRLTPSILTNLYRRIGPRRRALRR